MSGILCQDSIGVGEPSTAQQSNDPTEIEETPGQPATQQSAPPQPRQPSPSRIAGAEGEESSPPRPHSQSRNRRGSFRRDSSQRSPKTEAQQQQRLLPASPSASPIQSRLNLDELVAKVEQALSRMAESN